jgi:monoamine oxidase
MTKLTYLLTHLLYSPAQVIAGHPSRGGSPTQVDVVVVGAGLSGLAAAKALIHGGKKVAVVEARGRVGGRVENKQLKNGGVTELGAAFVGPTQDDVLALIEELGLQTLDEYNEGSNLAVISGERLLYDSSSPVPDLDDASLLAAGTAFATLDAYAASIDVEAPWSHPNATQWDSFTLDTWLSQQNLTFPVLALFNTAFPALISVEAGEVSFLYAVSYIASAGNASQAGTIERLVSVDNGAQEKRVVGGTGLLAPGLAKQIGESNIHLNSPVQAITKRDNSYIVQSSKQSFIAKDVVVAMSPPLAGRIRYDPPLSAQRDQLTQRMFMGSLGKATAIYAKPFWREANLTGQALTNSGTVRSTLDVSPDDGSYGAILGFIEADQMRALDDATDSEIAALVSEDYISYFGPQAANVSEWVIQRWDNEIYSRGGPVAVASPGTLSRYGPALRKPQGGIHWAGTESSDFWVGYMSGALRAGKRAAREILG